MTPGAHEQLLTIVGALETEWSTVSVRRTMSLLASGVTRETADRVLAEQKRQISGLRDAIPRVLSGATTLSAWKAWAASIHDALAALAGFVGKWSMSSVLAELSLDVAEKLPALGAGISSTLMWVAIGLAAVAVLYGTNTLRGLKGAV